ncbi:hypothetical protein [Pelagicoccus sp. SDUM812003]|uniref:hypothetical protein n=1 Tax=Pelagicoccus sp. SDUM812003 TaxID=3041267 RepID=UPI00280E3E24|nr:hypothetical protein [Pelagicoccus sp. SDUM812003]MDQ8202340.1 hypothetical protein [Pelagicoccus sp. SDUM812003]
MIDTTTPKDLAKKIEWIGLRNLSGQEREQVREQLAEVCCYLPRLLALALWSFFGLRAPDSLITRGPKSSLKSYREREEAKAYIRELLSDQCEEEENAF